VSDLASLPPALQRAIAARNAAVEPFSPTIDSLDVSWGIVSGNLRELVSTLDVFDTDDPGKAAALWHQPPPVKHRYHLEIVRRFHNLLSAAVAYLEHTRRASVLLKRFAPDTYTLYTDMQDRLEQRLGFLIAIRDFSIHSGAHQSVLALRGTTEGTLVGRVGFRVQPILSEQQAKLSSARSQRAKAAAVAAISFGETVEVRPLVADYDQQVNELRSRFRTELIRLHETLSNDLARWTAPDDRPAVVQYFIGHPIPVYRAGEQ
jgi:hypothetical protein